MTEPSTFLATGDRVSLVIAHQSASVDAEVVSVLGGTVAVEAAEPLADGAVLLKASVDGAAWELTAMCRRGPGRVGLLRELAVVGKVQERGWVRVPFFAPMSLTDFSHRTIDAVGLDLSSRGVSCIVETDPPQRADAKFRVQAGSIDLDVLAEVTMVRARVTGRRSWVAAYQFVDLDPSVDRALTEAVLRMTARDYVIA
jgi:hypothetical protein